MCSAARARGVGRCGEIWGVLCAPQLGVHAEDEPIEKHLHGANFLDDYKAERWAREADYRQASDPEAEQFIAERLWRARAALVHATRHGGSAWAAAARAPERRGRLRRSAREGNWRTERRL